MEIAIVHRDLLEKGGGETVVMNVLEEVQDDFDVTLITLVDPPFEELNDFYNTAVDEDNINVRTVGEFLKPFRDLNVRIMEVAIMNRYVNSVADDYDVLFSTSTDVLAPIPMIHYIHYPRPIDFYIGDEIDWSRPLSLFYHKMCARYSKFDRNHIEGDKVLTCSGWVSQKIEEVYECDSEVVYPPVDTQGLGNSDWEDRENGFVSIGRLRPTKNILRNIQIIDRLREKGMDTHLHIIGPKPDIEPNVYGGYYQQVVEEVEKRDYLYLEEDIGRDKLISLINSHKYGIHGKEEEQFGIAIAEMVAGGVIPFVPNSGGQTDIVNNQETLTYSSEEEAVWKIREVVFDKDKQEELRHNLEEKDSYKKSVFKQKIRSAIDEFIEEKIDG